MSNETIQIVILSGPSEPKRAIMGLSMAATAAAAGSKVNLYLAMDGAQWLSPRVCHSECVPGYPSVAELMSAIQQAGGALEYCPHCLVETCDHSLTDTVIKVDCCAGSTSPMGFAGIAVRMGECQTVVF